MKVNYMPDLFQVGTEVFSYGYSSIMVAKGSPLKDLFDMDILRILESGIFELQKDLELLKTAIPRRHKQIKSVDKNESLHFRQLQPMLILLGFGIFISFASFLVELGK